MCEHRNRAILNAQKRPEIEQNYDIICVERKENTSEFSRKFIEHLLKCTSEISYAFKEANLFESDRIDEVGDDANASISK